MAKIKDSKYQKTVITFSKYIGNGKGEFVPIYFDSSSGTIINDIDIVDVLNHSF